LSETETLSPVLPDAVEQATRHLLAKASERDLRLATAESCTGGMLASLLTDVQGVAHAFDRGFVTYSEEAKTEMLGVPAALIDAKGAVSRDVAIAMAEGALARSRANIALAITGFADAGDEPGSSTFVLRAPGVNRAPRGAFRPDRPRRLRGSRAGVAVEMMTEML
jgi:nicotinamide-nucleotide amidase